MKIVKTAFAVAALVSALSTVATAADYVVDIDQHIGRIVPGVGIEAAVMVMAFRLRFVFRPLLLFFGHVAGLNALAGYYLDPLETGGAIQSFQPAFKAESVADQQFGLGQGADILRRRLVDVSIAVRPDQHRPLAPLDDQVEPRVDLVRPVRHVDPLQRDRPRAAARP